MIKARLKAAEPTYHKAARSDGAVDTRSGTSVGRAMEAEKKIKIIPKKSYKILDKRKILWYNKSR